MILSSNQPYFLPYIGYWQLIAAADIFLICDNFNFIKHGWISRNRILSNTGYTYINLDLCKKSSNKLISDIYLLSNSYSREKLMRKVYYEYHKAPFFDAGYELFERVITFPETNLASFLENSIEIVCNYLNINTILKNTSELRPYGNLSKEEKIFVDCEQLSATTYINSIGGRSLYNKKQFAEHGIELKFLQPNLPHYKQFNEEFVSNLSVLDAIMFCSKENLQGMLRCYSLV